MNSVVGEALVRFYNLSNAIHVNRKSNNHVLLYICEGDSYWTDKVLTMASVRLGATWNIRVVEGRCCRDTNLRNFSHWMIDRVQVDVDRITSSFRQAMLSSDSFWSTIPEENVLVMTPGTILVRPIPEQLFQFSRVGTGRMYLYSKVSKQVAPDRVSKRFFMDHEYVPGAFGLVGVDQCLMTSREYQRCLS